MIQITFNNLWRIRIYNLRIYQNMGKSIALISVFLIFISGSFALAKLFEESFWVE